RAEAIPADVTALLPRSPRRTRRGEIEASSFSPEAVDRTFQLFRAAASPIADAGKLGYVLFQFAPWVHFDSTRVHYLASLPGRLPGGTIAIELRHRSWLPGHPDEALRVLTDAGLAHVIVDAPLGGHAIPRITTATAPTAVFRLHGRNQEGWLRQLRGEEPSVREKYDYLYSAGELRAFLTEIEAVSTETEEVFISFNNNNRDYPVKNALMMKRLLGQPTPTDSAPRDLFT